MNNIKKKHVNQALPPTGNPDMDQLYDEGFEALVEIWGSEAAAAAYLDKAKARFLKRLQKRRKTP